MQASNSKRKLLFFSMVLSGLGTFVICIVPEIIESSSALRFWQAFGLTLAFFGLATFLYTSLFKKEKHEY